MWYYIGPSSDWGYRTPASRRGVLDSIPDRAVFVLWWTSWYWDRLLWEYFDFPISLSFQQYTVQKIYRPTWALKVAVFRYGNEVYLLNYAVFCRHVGSCLYVLRPEWFHGQVSSGDAGLQHYRDNSLHRRYVWVARSGWGNINCR